MKTLRIYFKNGEFIDVNYEIMKDFDAGIKLYKKDGNYLNAVATFFDNGITGYF